jgi:hypothetical protein
MLNLKVWLDRFLLKQHYSPFLKNQQPRPNDARYASEKTILNFKVSLGELNPSMRDLKTKDPTNFVGSITHDLLILFSEFTRSRTEMAKSGYDPHIKQSSSG